MVQKDKPIQIQVLSGSYELKQSLELHPDP